MIFPRNADEDERATLPVRKNIVNACAELFGEIPELDSLFSNEQNIFIRNGKQPVSAREIFAGHKFGQLGSFPNRLAVLREAAGEAALDDRDLGIYDTFRWIQSIGERVAKGESVDIYPTPYTKSLEEAIGIALKRRNGLLKYVLFGGPGTGKTRLIQEMNSQLGKETGLISGHYYLSFDDLIAQTAISVDLGGGNSTLDRIDRLQQRYGNGQTSEAFWRDMEKVYKALPEGKQREYKDVEGMIRHNSASVSLEDETLEDGVLIAVTEDDNRQWKRRTTGLGFAACTAWRSNGSENRHVLPSAAAQIVSWPPEA